MMAYFSNKAFLIKACTLASQVALVVKNPPAMQEMQETWAGSLSQGDSLQEEMVPLSSTLDWEISCTEEPGGLQPMGSQRVGHD